jgi:hypothetical protein
VLALKIKCYPYDEVKYSVSSILFLALMKYELAEKQLKTKKKVSRFSYFVSYLVVTLFFPVKKTLLTGKNT